MSFSAPLRAEEAKQTHSDITRWVTKKGRPLMGHICDAMGVSVILITLGEFIIYFFPLEPGSIRVDGTMGITPI